MGGAFEVDLCFKTGTALPCIAIAMYYKIEIKLTKGFTCFVVMELPHYYRHPLPLLLFSFIHFILMTRKNLHKINK